MENVFRILFLLLWLICGIVTYFLERKWYLQLDKKYPTLSTSWTKGAFFETLGFAAFGPIGLMATLLFQQD